ncbi:ATP-dependent Clp protease, ATP-binding subunit ClpX [Batrachochytrium salamandrivorans]|nr:ATP-dependent Clp protease, ATP-binding subunit ClpX [Batrachochytrium salamandrivorans]
MSFRNYSHVTWTRAARRRFERTRRLSQAATSAFFMGRSRHGGGLSSFDGSSSLLGGSSKQSLVCPRCKTGVVGAGAGVCESCQLETNSLTPKMIFDKLSRYVVQQDAVKQVLAVAMFSHSHRVKANEALRFQDSNNDEHNDKAEDESNSDDPSPAAEYKIEQEISTRTGKSLQITTSALLVEGEFTSTDRAELRQLYERYPLSLKRDLTSSDKFNQLSLTDQAQLLEELVASTTDDDDDNEPVIPSSLGGVGEYNKRLGSITELNVKRFDKSNVLLLGPTGSGKTLMVKTMAEVMRVPMVICDATTLTAAGYVGDDVESVLFKLMDVCNWEVSKAERGVVFLDEVDKIAKRYSGGSKSKDVGGESVQMGLLKMLEGTKVTLSKKGLNGHTTQVVVDTSNILFVCSGAFTGIDEIVSRRTSARSLGFGNQVAKSYDDESEGNHDLRDKLMSQVEVADLVDFGLIPEFVGRFSAITSTSFLTAKDLVRILVEPENSVVNQMKGLFKLSFASPVNLEFTPKALDAIAQLALQRKSGARGLKLILEKILSEATYDLPDSPWVTRVVVDADAVTGQGKCLLMTERDYEAWLNNNTPAVVAAAAEDKKRESI